MTKDAVKFSTSGDIGSANVMCRHVARLQLRLLGFRQLGGPGRQRRQLVQQQQLAAGAVLLSILLAGRQMPHAAD